MKRFLLSFLPLLIAAAAHAQSSRLVGQWQSANGPDLSEFELRKDGAFTGRVVENGKDIVKFSGKWFLKDDVINYDYAASSNPSIVSAGFKDRASLEDLTPDYYIIEGANGVHAFTRVTGDSAATAKMDDKRLREMVSGVWFCESLNLGANPPVHAGERSQYFPDGTFVEDYRLSYVGAALYFRTTGTWSIKNGIFAETTLKSSDRKRKIPPLTRSISSINGNKMVIVSGDQTHAMTLYKGEGKLDSGKISVNSLDEKKLLEDLQAMHMGGFLPIPVNDKGTTYSGWRVDSRVVTPPPGQ